MRFQHDWAERTHRLGVSTAPIRSRRLTVERLCEALSIVTSDEAMRSRARRLGERVRSEDGVAGAVELIEEHFGLGRTPVGQPSVGRPWPAELPG